MVEKLIRDGKVAVIYSPGYGAGWSTWAHGEPDTIVRMIFDRELAELVLKYDDRPRLNHGESTELEREVTLWAAKHGITEYMGGACQLRVEWVQQGCAMRVLEYDGSESIELYDMSEWLVA